MRRQAMDLMQCIDKTNMQTLSMMLPSGLVMLQKNNPRWLSLGMLDTPP